MTQEEKLEEAKRLYKTANADQKYVLERLFPELKESEDERIIKELTSLFKDDIKGINHRYTGEDCERWVAWLERQGEKKPEVKYVYTRFRIGDVVVESKPDGYCQPVRVKYVDKESYSCESDDGKRFLSFPIISQDEYELVKQVSVWSEEGEAKIVELKSFIAQCNGFNKENRNKAFDLIDSIKPRHTWKPSKEQMEYLHKYAEQNNYDGAILTSLYNDLKRLKQL